jgi:hypothetical protein
VILPDGAVDSHYTIISRPFTPFPVPAIVVAQDGFPIPPWVANGPNSKWVGNNVGGDSGPTGLYLFRTTFDLTGLDPSTASLSGKWSTDNNGLDILINGSGTGNTTGFADFGSLHPFTISSGFVSGINTLDFAFYDGGVAAGLRVDGLDGKADPVPSATPEPCSLALLFVGGAPVVGRLLRRRK